MEAIVYKYHQDIDCAIFINAFQIESVIQGAYFLDFPYKIQMPIYI